MNASRPYGIPSETARGFENYLRSTKAGHFPIYDGDRIVGVFVSVDHFNVLEHLAGLLDDPRMAAAVVGEPSKEGERHLSLEDMVTAVSEI